MSGRALMTAFAILCAVADAYGLTSGDLLGRNRRADIVTARHAAMSLIRDQLKLSHQHVGDVFGMDHATVIHACKNVRNWLQVDTEFRGKFVEVMAAAINARRSAQDEFKPEAEVECKSGNLKVKTLKLGGAQ